MRSRPARADQQVTRNHHRPDLIAGLTLLAMNARAENADREAGQPAARMIRLTERVWVCQIQYAEQKPKGFFPVIVSRDGLVVVDTPMFPSEARAMRAAIIDELGRSDFLYLINTHHHWDHTMGNQFFREATIVGHAFHTDRHGDIHGRTVQNGSSSRGKRPLKKASSRRPSL